MIRGEAGSPAGGCGLNPLQRMNGKKTSGVLALKTVSFETGSRMTTVEQIAAEIAVIEKSLTENQQRLVFLKTRMRDELAQKETLSPRVRSVLLLAKEYTNKEIAAQLGISERTVKFHVSKLLARFDVSRRAELPW